VAPYCERAQAAQCEIYVGHGDARRESSTIQEAILFGRWPAYNGGLGAGPPRCDARLCLQRPHPLRLRHAGRHGVTAMTRARSGRLVLMTAQTVAQAHQTVTPSGHFLGPCFEVPWSFAISSRDGQLRRAHRVAHFIDAGRTRCPHRRPGCLVGQANVPPMRRWWRRSTELPPRRKATLSAVRRKL